MVSVRLTAVGAALSLVAVVLLVAAPVPAAEAKQRSCSLIEGRDDWSRGWFTVNVERGRVRCRLARRVARALFSDDATYHRGRSGASSYWWVRIRGRRWTGGFQGGYWTARRGKRRIGGRMHGNRRPKVTEQSRVTMRGIGPIRIGMTERRAARVGKLVFDGSGIFEATQCEHLDPRGSMSRDFSLMTIEGRIARVEIHLRGLRAAGVRVGDSERSVRRRFRGRLDVKEHVYHPDGSYLVLEPRNASSDRRIVFVTDGSRVRAIWAGRLPAVLFVEGCIP